MTIDAAAREHIRQRANCACEYCGVSETDTGGLLTIDHFQPVSKGGSDSLENLLYCCVRCNQYKMNYWPVGENDPQLWHPRTDSAADHFLELEDGTLHGISEAGRFTLRRLRLNRAPLVAYRLRKQRLLEKSRLLDQYRNLVSLQERLVSQQSTLLSEQQQLLAIQKQYLELLLGRSKHDE